MTLIVTSPLTGDPFGPGFNLSASSTLIGPLEPGSFWRITLTAPANEDVVLVMTVPTVTNALSTTVIQGSTAAPQIVPGRGDWTTGAAAQVEVELVEPTSGTIDDATVQVVLDREAGQNAEFQAWLTQKLLAQPVGLTTDQGEQLARVEAGMAIGLGVLPIDLVGGLADALVNGPGLSVGSLSDPYSLTGDGEMPDIATSFRTRLGIYFVATTIPPGLGHRHGQSEEYPARLVQWRTVHSVGGIELVTEVADFVTHGEIWRWREAKPLRIEYSILPGVTISARWHWWP